MLMTCIQKLLLVFEKLIERRLASIEGSRKIIHRRVVEAFTIERSCGGTNDCLAPSFAQRRSIEELVFLRHRERLFVAPRLGLAVHQIAPLRLLS